VRALLADSLARGATVTANRELAGIRKFFSWCIEGDIIEVNPAAGIREPAKETARDRVLSDAELRLVWLAAEGDGYPFGPLVQLLLLTAQRRLEAAGAAWSEFDLTGGNWDLPGKRTKNGRAHSVPLSDAALAVLADIPRFPDGDFVFGSGGRSAFTGYSKAKARLDRRIAEIAGGPVIAWTLHDLRRTAATRMADIGIFPHVVEEILNHASARSGVAGTYNRSRLEPEKRDGLERWGRYVERLVSPDAESTVVDITMRRA
jgi:integrase